MKKQVLEKILDALEKRVNDTMHDDLYGVCEPIEIGSLTVWIEDYDLSDSTFTVCIDGKNTLEHPNVEKCLSNELGKRIPDLGERMYIIEEERRKEAEEIRETERMICQTNGWSY